MHALLEDIELDVQELKCTTLAVMKGEAADEVAKRSLIRLKERLAALEHALDEHSAERVAVASPLHEESGPEERNTSSSAEAEEPAGETAAILADCIRVSVRLRRALSLNDSFRFAHELFGGDMALMNSALDTLEKSASLAEAQETLHTLVSAGEENPALEEFTELLKKHFG